MPDIKIDLPDTFNFSANIPVRITDLNYGGHVGNDTILSIVHEARMQFLQHYRYTELNLGGVGLIMKDATLSFKSELFYREIIIASVSAFNFSKIGFDLVYKLEKDVNEKRVLVAIASTGMICFDYKKRKIVSLPDEVRTKLETKN